MNKLRGATQRNKNYTEGTNWDNKSFTITFNRKKKIKRKIKNIKNKIYIYIYIHTNILAIIIKKIIYTYTHKIQKYIKEKDLTRMIIHYI